MSINSRGEITIYYGACLNYAPDKTFPISGLIDQDIGQVYKCRLLSNSKECYGCSNYKNKNDLTDIERFKKLFLELLKEVINCNKDQILTSPFFTNSFDTLTIDKGLEELIKENKINAEYSFNGPVYSNIENKLQLEELSNKILGTIKTLLTSSNKTGIIQFSFTYLEDEYNITVDLRECNLLNLMIYTGKDKQTSTSVNKDNKLYIYLNNIINEKFPKRFSTRLKLLLIASKKKEGEFNKEFVASVLAEEYHPSMTLLDALHHCVAAYQEALEYKQFELAYRGDSQTLLMELLKAPGKQELFPKATDTYSLEQYYNSFINHILQQLRLTNVGWCRKELGFD